MYDIVFIGNQHGTGMNTVAVSPDSLIKLKGQIGDFELTFRDWNGISAINAKAIVINAQPEERLPIVGAMSIGAMSIEAMSIGDVGCDAAAVAVEAKGAYDSPAVFLQDYGAMTPACYSISGLQKAIEIRTVQKKEVIYLYRSMRFGDGDSSLYKKARELGVVFEKFTNRGLNITHVGNETDLYQDNRDESQVDKDETAERGFLIEFINEALKFNIRTDSLYVAPLIHPAPSYEKIASVLNIKKGPEGFLQADNIYLQPTRTSRRGIYAMGFSRGRNGMSAFESDIHITLSDIESETGILRKPDNAVREVSEETCALCYTCYRSCPHGAIERDEQKDCMKVNAYACYGCNTCISVCPAKAISIKEEDISTGVSESAVVIPEESSQTNQQKRPYKILLCRNSAQIAYREARESGLFPDGAGFRLDEQIEVMTIPCSNSVQKADLYRVMADGESRILVLGCINEACKHLDGDVKFERVVREAKKNLTELGLDPGRIEFHRVSLRMGESLKEIVKGFTGVK